MDELALFSVDPATRHPTIHPLEAEVFGGGSENENTKIISPTREIHKKVKKKTPIIPEPVIVSIYLNEFLAGAEFYGGGKMFFVLSFSEPPQKTPAILKYKGMTAQWGSNRHSLVTFPWQQMSFCLTIYFLLRKK